MIEVYAEIGKYLSKFKSGKLPKAFKIIPRLSNWEEVRPFIVISDFDFIYRFCT